MDAKSGVDLSLGEKIYKKSSLFNIMFGVFIVLGIIVTFCLIKKNKKNKLEPDPKADYKLPTVVESTNVHTSVVDEKLEESKGHEFEKFVADKFDKNYFQMIDTRSDKKFDNHTPLSNMDPDFEFVYKGPPKSVNFAIECKWRSNFFKNSIEWAKQYQLDNYRNYAMRTGQPVFIILGVGGLPSQPNDLYIIPLIEIDECILSKEKLNRYYRHKKGNFFLELSAMKLI